VNHHRSRHRLVGGHVFQPEALRQQEIDLVGREGELPPDGVLDLDVQLGAVEGGLAGRLGERMTGRLQGVARGVLGLVPDHGVTHPFAAGLVPQG